VKDPSAALDVGIHSSDNFEEMAQPVILEAGQISAHDPWLVHSSNPNTSDKRRAGITFLYMAAESFFDRENLKPASKGYGYETRPLYWVAGDVCNSKNTLVDDIRQEAE
jgi:ectoine hydroxylase-related dioxygenase (phytanoyl-CoA dioxygenase family)